MVIANKKRMRVERRVEMVTSDVSCLTRLSPTDHTTKAELTTGQFPQSRKSQYAVRSTIRVRPAVVWQSRETERQQSPSDKPLLEQS